MYKLIGEYKWMGYTKAYDIQKRTWYGRWKTIETATADLKKIKSGKLSSNAEVVYEE